MGRINVGFVCVAAITLVAFAMVSEKASGQAPQNLYSCFGGCYNVCFLLDGVTLDQRYPCYLNCLPSCFSPSSLEDQLYYCHLGCSAQRCLQLKKESARKQCFSSCGSVCTA